MDNIIKEFLEMCGNDKRYACKVAERLLELFNRTDEIKLLGYCERCGAPIYENAVYCKVDDVYYCVDCDSEYK